MTAIDITVPKGFAKKLYEYNQDLKQLFGKYLLTGKLCIDANIDSPLTSLNYSLINPFEELGGGFPGDCIIDTRAIYQHLQKGRQKVRYIRISERGLFFIKEEDDTYIELEFGQLVTDKRFDERIKKYYFYKSEIEDCVEEYLLEEHLRSLLSKKFVYLPCGDNELIIGYRLLPGIKDGYTVTYRYSLPFSINDKSGENHFVTQISIDMKTIVAHYLFEASVF